MHAYLYMLNHHDNNIMILQTTLLNNSIKQNMPPRHYHIMNVVES